MIPIFKVYMDTIELGRVASQLKEDTLPVTNTFFAVRASNKPARPSNIVVNLNRKHHKKYFFTNNMKFFQIDRFDHSFTDN